jgi:hypothetical protein
MPTHRRRTTRLRCSKRFYRGYGEVPYSRPRRKKVHKVRTVRVVALEELSSGEVDLDSAHFSASLPFSKEWVRTMGRPDTVYRFYKLQSSERLKVQRQLKPIRDDEEE